MVKPLSFSSYIVHIYRLQKNHPRGLVGILEKVGSKGKKAFSNYDELWDILSAGKKPSRRRNQAPTERKIESKERVFHPEKDG